jgi:hypothetical protein
MPGAELEIKERTMRKTIALDDQIVTILTKPCASDKAAEVLAEAEAKLTELTERADGADTASLSPLASAAKAHELRQEASDHRFAANRMEASVSSLRERLAELKEAEAEAARAAEYDETIKERDTLAADIARDYPRVIGILTSLAKRIVENDARCAKVGIRESAEYIGRGIPGLYVNGTPVHRIQSIRLQMPGSAWDAYDHSNGGTWNWRGLDLAADKTA